MQHMVQSLWHPLCCSLTLSLAYSMRLIHAQSQYKVHILPLSFLSLTINQSLFLLSYFSLSVQWAGVMVLHSRSMKSLITRHKLASLTIMLCISTLSFPTEPYSISSVPVSIQFSHNPQLLYHTHHFPVFDLSYYLRLICMGLLYHIICCIMVLRYSISSHCHECMYEMTKMCVCVCVNLDCICTSTRSNYIICACCILYI